MISRTASIEFSGEDKEIWFFHSDLENDTALIENHLSSMTKNLMLRGVRSIFRFQFQHLIIDFMYSKSMNFVSDTCVVTVIFFNIIISGSSDKSTMKSSIRYGRSVTRISDTEISFKTNRLFILEFLTVQTHSDDMINHSHDIADLVYSIWINCRSVKIGISIPFVNLESMDIFFFRVNRIEVEKSMISSMFLTLLKNLFTSI